MKQNVTLLNLPDIQLVVCRATVFPAGIKAAWDQLESKLPSLRGRKFYGLTFREDEHLVYYAGLEPLDENEISRLGFPTMILRGGKYARVKLLDWTKHADQISGIFDELMEQFKKDRAGPTIEFYRSQSELHLMIPLLEA
jgi:hypothetical protein